MIRFAASGLGMVTWLLAVGTLLGQDLVPVVRVGFRNDLPVPILIRDLTQPLAPPIRLVPKETVWDRMPANAKIPVAISDGVTGQLLATTVVVVPPNGSVLFLIQRGPTGNVGVTPQPAP
jgi:hypothetical protein